MDVFSIINSRQTTILHGALISVQPTVIILWIAVILLSTSSANWRSDIIIFFKHQILQSSKSHWSRRSDIIRNSSVIKWLKYQELLSRDAYYLVKAFKSFSIYIPQADHLSKPQHDLSSYSIVSTWFNTIPSDNTSLFDTRYFLKPRISCLQVIDTQISSQVSVSISFPSDRIDLSRIPSLSDSKYISLGFRTPSLPSNSFWFKYLFSVLASRRPKSFALSSQFRSRSLDDEIFSLFALSSLK